MIRKTGLSELNITWIEKRNVCYSPHAHFSMAEALDYPFAELMKVGQCIDSYKDADHVRRGGERMFYEKNIRSSFHISNVEDLNDGDIKEMNSIIKKEFSDDE